MIEQAAKDETPPGSLLGLALLSLVAGALAGLIGAAFRLSLTQGNEWRAALIEWAHEREVVGLVVVLLVCAGATAVSAWLVRAFAPQASGSGIPHVECVLHEQLPPAPFRLLPIKFVGGVLAMGAGLALGREGPSVQMGATLAELLGRVFRLTRADCRVLLAAGAGAGLATAFNAPIAGAVFVLEELLRRFDTRTTIATFGASAGAIAVSRLFLGDAPDFPVAGLQYPLAGDLPVYLVLGVVAGLLGIVYNRGLLATLGIVDRLRRCPVELLAALIGAGVGLVAWFHPRLVGGGDGLTQAALTSPPTLSVLGVLFLLRFGLALVSYAARTPGGLFAPMLVLGAQSGVVVGTLAGQCFPELALNPAAVGVVGMAAFFTGVVRAPLTGIILVIEMTAGFTLLLPMLGACFTAMLLPTLLGNPPIYDSLRERTLDATVPRVSAKRG